MNRFIDNGHGIVIDILTGLMWQQQTAGRMTEECRMSKQIDHIHTSGKIVCPHCGYEIDDEDYRREEIFRFNHWEEQCNGCSKRFKLNGEEETTTYWTTEKIED